MSHAQSSERIIPIQLENENDLPELTDDDSELEYEDSDEVRQQAYIKQIKEMDNLVLSFMKEIQNKSLQMEPPKNIEYNTAEKIIIVLDTAGDNISTQFQINKHLETPFEMLKRSVKSFLQLKSLISYKHQFSLYTLNSKNADLIVPFTNEIEQIIKKLNTIETTDTEDIIDLKSLLDEISMLVQVPPEEIKDGIVVPPSYTVRIVLFYGRSYSLPILNLSSQIEDFLTKKYFTFDILLSHEPVGPDNNGAKIIKSLKEMNTGNNAYFLPVVRNAKLLYRATAQLVGHPLLRSLQSLADYEIKDSEF